MSLPFIYILQSHSSNIIPDLQKRYENRYRVQGAGSGADALSSLQKHREKNEDVALLLVDQSLPDMPSTDFIAKAANFFPEARKVLFAQ
ncbi:MAG: fused response regulator/thioredoxin-disulfide reductase, partial [Chloroflexota bacterium]